jgi:hypothetical protein
VFVNSAWKHVVRIPRQPDYYPADSVHRIAEMFISLAREFITEKTALEGK